MRLLAAALCIGLAGCSSALDALPDGGEPPVLSAVTGVIRTVAAEAKLSSPLEVAGPIRAHPISSDPWIICVRSQAPDSHLNRTYAIFFKDGKFVSFRMTALVDQCDSQKFTGL
ncbi:hypothetical protein [Bradyrhizobium sp. LMTR 3]|uniref:hypothetical protein n=1 Tax=Bradyrhizobium sp. LMTR 3 TaxID=189873 RepID=UPI0008105FE8|nr:hypothetical protein [Bradyrhizobium sp. LMTR 3]OCK57481.1 hypothetical protein LMTR3_07905 [Bradyrhizobium sp. LMTR 3]